MKKIIIKNKDGLFLQAAKFETDEKLNKFLDILAKGDSWGTDYLTEITDISEEENLKKSKIETKKVDHLDRVDKFKNIDWSKSDTIPELKAILKMVVKEIIKDEE